MLSAASSFLSALDDGLERTVKTRPILCLSLCGALLVLGFCAWPSSQDTVTGPSPADEASLQGLSAFFYGRPFIDKFPSDERAKYEFYYFTKRGVAIFAELEYYKEVDEFFFFKNLLSRMVYWFPHSKLKGLTKYELEECQGHGTFDLKLTVYEDPKNEKRKRVYYSWKRFGKDSLPARCMDQLATLQQRAATVDAP